MLPLPLGQIRSVWELFLYKGDYYMSNTPVHLSLDDQVKLLAERKMVIKNFNTAASKLEKIGYYKLKEAAYPLSKIEILDGNKIRVYPGVTFEQVLTRYYQDKNLRTYLLHAIEEIEVSVKARLSYVLGKDSYGPFGYLEFKNWCNRDEYCKYYLSYKQSYFQNDMRKKTNRSRNHDIQNQSNLKSGLPSIWLAVDVLTFGNVIDLVSLMSKRNLRELSSYYNCDIDSFLSWLKCLHLVRNICAHNGNIIDLKLKTTPLVKDEWKELLFQFKDGRYSNRIAIVICIIKHFLLSIDPHYNYDRIYSSFNAIINGSNDMANSVGFKTTQVITELMPKRKKSMPKKKYRKKN